MLYKILGKNEYEDFLSDLISKNEVIGPKKKDGAYSDFVAIKDPKEIDTDYQKTTLSPAKKILFPSTEDLVAFKISDTIEAEGIVEYEQKVLLGINAWDINGMNFLDRFFTTDFIDENYLAKRKALTVIGTDSVPTENNFAHHMNSEYAIEGFDLYFSDLGDRFFVRAATEKGNRLIEDFPRFLDTSEDDFKEFNRYMEDYRAKFKLNINMKNFIDNFESIYDKEQLWQKLAEKCYSCGSCNLTCPTCFCFNVKDDINLDLKTGQKLREWDSCMIPEYGLVAGDHNFRPDKENRLKQRYKCKLITFKQKYGKNSCVGCGRCIEACLAKINIAEDINTIMKEVSI